jgi:hypothetical protein
MSLLKSAFVVALPLLLAVPAAAVTIITTGTIGTTGATALYPSLPAEISASQVLTPAIQASFLGAPNDGYTGLGAGTVTYDFGVYRLFNGTGQDFNVYEYNAGSPEFTLADILVSADGSNFFNVEGSFAAAIDLAGDELHGNASFRRSYDLADAVTALGASEFRYLRIVGTSTGLIRGSAGFDLDAVGGINFREFTPPVGGIPEPTSWAMLVLGFGMIGSVLRRRSPAKTIA